MFDWALLNRQSVGATPLCQSPPLKPRHALTQVDTHQPSCWDTKTNDAPPPLHSRLFRNVQGIEACPWEPLAEAGIGKDGYSIVKDSYSWTYSNCLPVSHSLHPSVHPDWFNETRLLAEVTALNLGTLYGTLKKKNIHLRLSKFAVIQVNIGVLRWYSRFPSSKCN